MNVGVIIVAYNGEKWIRDCIGSLVNSTIPLNVFVIDNGSTDRTIPIVREEFPQCEVICTGENLGFGKANNIGLKIVLERGYDYVYLLNQDAWVESDTIEKLIAIQKKHPEYGVLSPFQTYKDSRDNLNEFFKDCLMSWNAEVDVLDDIASGNSKEVYQVDFIMAAHWLMPLETVRRIGGFAPIFSHYGEDDNYLHRLKYHGMKTGVCPGIYGVHDIAGRVEALTRRVARIYIRFLAWACDINRGSFKSLEKGFRAAGAEALRVMSEHKTFKPLYPMMLCVWNIPNVLKTRKQTKTLGANYLK